MGRQDLSSLIDAAKSTEKPPADSPDATAVTNGSSASSSGAGAQTGPAGSAATVQSGAGRGTTARASSEAPKASKHDGQTRPKPAKAKTTRPTSTGATYEGYQAFERLDTRLRDDQILELERIARRLTKLRKPDEPRVTKNTLIRVGVDLLLHRNPEGGNEEQIRRSVGL